jgi:hypothetical protein
MAHLEIDATHAIPEATGTQVMDSNRLRTGSYLKVERISFGWQLRSRAGPRLRLLREFDKPEIF